MSHSLADPRGRAQTHADKARSIVARQRVLIERLRDRGRDCGPAEDLLATFEVSLAIAESSLGTFRTLR